MNKKTEKKTVPKKPEKCIPNKTDEKPKKIFFLTKVEGHPCFDVLLATRDWLGNSFWATQIDIVTAQQEIDKIEKKQMFNRLTKTIQSIEQHFQSIEKQINRLQKIN